ncbi:MAG: hypothetical protein R2706_17125 [Acidimicrobiales bacterium]
MEVSLFDSVGDALRSLLPPELAVCHIRSHRRGIKVWFGPAEGNRDHYESQIIARRHVDDVEGMAIETGFHAEQKSVKQNDNTLAILLAAEPDWRQVLGAEATAGPFYGRPDDWRRLSDVWFEPDLDDPDIAFELAARLADYITVIEPLLADRQ